MASSSVGLAVGGLHDPDVVAERVTDTNIGTVGLFDQSRASSWSSTNT